MLKRTWSIIGLFILIINLIPIQVFAIGEEPLEVVYEEVFLRDRNYNEITENNRITSGEELRIDIHWKLAQKSLVEAGQKVVKELPSELSIPDQKGMLEFGAGNYQIINNQMELIFNQNYEVDDYANILNFESVKKYEGVLQLIGYSNEGSYEERAISFGGNLTKILYLKNSITEKSTEFSNDNQNGIVASNLEDEQLVHLEKEIRAEGTDLSGIINLISGFKLTDKDGNSINSNNPVLRNEIVNITLDWNLKNSEDVKNGDYYSYKLPEEFVIYNEVTGNLSFNDSSDSMGTFKLGTDGILIITFNEKVETLSNKNGIIKFTSTLDIDKQKESISIDTDIKDENGEDIIIDFEIYQPSIRKDGNFSDSGTGINWTIYANENGKSLKNAVITDVLPENLNWTLSRVYIQKDGDWIEDNGELYVRSDSSFIFAQLDYPVKIVIQTTIKDSNNYEPFRNTATISGDNFRNNSAEATVQQGNGKYNLSLNPVTGEIKWMIQAIFANNDGKLVDTLTNQHTFISEKITIQKYNGNTWNDVDSDKYSIEIDETEKQLTIDFKDPGEYRIYYSTQIDTALLPITDAGKYSFRNSATITDGDKTTDYNNSVWAVPEDNIIKKAGSIDYNEQTIVWTIEANKNKVEMNNGVIRDVFDPKAHLSLLTDSLEIKDSTGKTLTNGVDYYLNKLDNSPVTTEKELSDGFLVRLTGDYQKTSETILLSFKTKYLLPSEELVGSGINSGNVHLRNTSYLSYIDEEGHEHSSSSSAIAYLSKDVSYRGKKYGIFVKKGETLNQKDSNLAAAFFDGTTNLDKDKVFWAALFNMAKEELDVGTEITEAIGSGQELDSLEIYTINLKVTNSVIMFDSVKDKLQKNIDYSLVKENGEIKIKLLNKTTETLGVFVSTNADEDTYLYKNDASLMDTKGNETRVSAAVPKSNETDWINKTGDQNSHSADLLDFQIDLNRDGHTINNAKIEDTVKTNQQTFRMDSIALYKAKVDPAGKPIITNGKFEIDSAQKIEPDTIDVTSDFITKEQTLVITFKEAITGPVVLVYQTVLDSAINNAEKVSNQAKLTGTKNEISEVVKEVEIKRTTGSGTSTGVNGELEIRKTDENNALISNSDAWFSLSRYNENLDEWVVLFDRIIVKGDKIYTDSDENYEDPQLSISGLLYGDYKLEETQAPEGYQLDPTPIELTIDKDKIQHTINVINPKEVHEASALLQANKILIGKTLTAEAYNFILKDKLGNELQVVTNDEAGIINFAPIVYDQAGTYHYTIAEVRGNEVGITYDTHTINVTVVVTDKAGSLEAEVKYSGRTTFKNNYKPVARSVVLQANKILVGKTLTTGAYNFILKDEAEKELQTATNDEAGIIDFAPIVYDEVGTYHYTIAEVRGNEMGIIYDSHIISVTVTVTDKAGKLDAKVVYTGDTSFKNVYSQKLTKLLNANQLPQTASKQAVRILPKTGGQTTIWLSILGIITTVAIGVYSYFRKS